MTHKHIPTAVAAAAALTLSALALPAIDQTIWIEGEDAQVDDMNEQPQWYDRVDRAMLSGGDWISNFHKTDAGRAGYRFEVGRDMPARARFLVRANPVKNELAYRLNGGAFEPVPFDRATDHQNVAADGGVDLRFLAWVDLGEVELKRGVNTLEFRTKSAGGVPQNHGAIDAVVFTADDAFTPEGTRKPGEAAADEGATGAQETYAFRPGVDDLGEDAVLDLRDMNEDEAGEGGFVKLSEDGNSFVRGDGEPIRFWAVNDYEFRDLDVEELTAHAEFLAKRGVNMARWHGELPSETEGAKLGDIDEKNLDDLHKYVAAFKRAGIYLTVSPYYPHAMGKKGSGNKSANIPATYEWPRDSEGMTGLVYFVPAVQEAYKTWLREMMTRDNPYTGVPLKDEPAVAVVQMQNEDSLLFWTMARIDGAEAEILAGRFGDFLAEKYGSLDKAKAALGDSKPQGPLGEMEDDWDNGVVAVSNVWNMTQPRTGNEVFDQRIDDQTEFLTTLMRDWHAEVARYLKEDLGSEHLFNPGNWRTADNLLLDDHERYSYAIDGAVVGLNRYTNSLHEGPNRGWAIVEGDLYTNESALKDPAKLQVAVKQPEGHPFIFPECLWVPPMWYQAEGPWLTAAYSSLNGADVAYWFANGEPQWRQPGSANGFLPSVGKWVLATPGHLAMFPAASIIFRNGYLDEGEPAVIEYRPPAEELWKREAPLISFEGAYDPNRDNVAQPGGAAGQGVEENADRSRTAIPREAFLVGPVKAVFETGEDEIVDLTKYVDGDVVTSNTGQLRWDKGVGYATMNAPKAQGAAGFLADAGAIELADVTIEYAPPIEHADDELAPSTGYAAVSVVPLDDQALARSGRVLVQVGTVARPTGWQVEEAEHEGRPAYRVVSYGKAPWRVEKPGGLTLSLANAGLSKATVLDPNGRPAGEAAVERDGDRLVLQFPDDAMYVVLE